MTNDIIKRLPRRLQLRFESLSGYVRAVVAEEEARSDKKIPALTHDQINLVQFVVFVYSLDAFLRDGTRAAREAAVCFEALGGKGFAVGGAMFTVDNDNTRRGERLAEELRGVLRGSRFANLLGSASSMQQLTKNLVREVRRGKPDLG